MTDQTTQDEINSWHKYFAVNCNNEAWNLIDKPERTAAEERQMLYLAFTAAFHWSKIGTRINYARAEILLAHALSLVDNGDQAMQYALSALSFFEAGNGEDWDLAFAHLEASLAAATQGDQQQHRLHYQKAHELGEAIHEPEDQKIFMQMFSHIPAP